MKKIFFALLLFVATNKIVAQIIKVSSGTDFVIKSGTTFSTDNLTLVPSADFTLSDISISRNSTVSNSTLNTANYIARVYLFSAITPVFSGTVQINYNDGAELNSIAESALRVNIHNGSAWSAYASGENNTSSNFVLSTTLSSVALNEITLADAAHALPVNWLSFTAKKQGKNVQLNWSTSSEQNSRDFTVQHSLVNGSFINIGVVAAAGNSNTVKNYAYLHRTAAKGKNFYRILQRDFDGKFNYSEERMITMDAAAFMVLGNPVINGVLQFATAVDQTVQLYSLEGKLIFSKQVLAGTHFIDVQTVAKGIYLLKAGTQIEKIVIE
ncbi:MAG: T9SS type A sorting domain-containing protein [Chitinophagaceae bacterium]|nr:MAG: T9SS type A sorting domain-containing protein [Chitinophagaceae bacterium]